PEDCFAALWGFGAPTTFFAAVGGFLPPTALLPAGDDFFAPAVFFGARGRWLTAGDGARLAFLALGARSVADLADTTRGARAAVGSASKGSELT
ncbi:hypothetical protein M1M06_30810, partial [Ralstonia insidiosa]|uniref:hypothetical protein n=1 Tax=Ralstonia insidiosa TaxID=190721 RepID=UPI00200A8967